MMMKSLFGAPAHFLVFPGLSAAGSRAAEVAGVPEALEGAGFLVGALPFLDPFFVTGAGALSVASVSVLGRAAGNGEV